jgi:hypothetical protein
MRAANAIPAASGEGWEFGPGNCPVFRAEQQRGRRNLDPRQKARAIGCVGSAPGH